jgi:hypothetical protein
MRKGSGEYNTWWQFSNIIGETEWLRSAPMLSNLISP